MHPSVFKTGAENPETDESSRLASVQEALGTILQSAPFRTTRQCQELLRYIVERTLEGQDQALRERIIGIEVFHRRPDYDTSDDPVVRIRAADVRRRLAQFYQGPQGTAVAVRIDVPPGSYRATFTWTNEVTPESYALPPVESMASGVETLDLKPASNPLELVQERAPRPKARFLSLISGHLWAALSAALLLALVFTAGYFQLPTQKAETAFSRFWAPVFEGPRPVLICMGSNVAYQFSHSFMVQYFQEHPLAKPSMEAYVDLPPDTLIPARDIHRARDSFVALGDVAAATRVVSTLTRKSKAYEERFPPDISFAELQNTPTILIGGFNNELTLALTRDLRFVLAENSRIQDTQEPAKGWSVQFNGDARDAEDYAIVARLLNSKSGGPVIVLAGIGQYGTQAAAEFVSNPQRIADLVKSAPKGWQRKNVQLVLHVKVIDFRPVSIEVVGSHYW